MLRLPFSFQGTNIAFTAGGIVITVAAAGEMPVGHWKTDTAANSIIFDINGAPATATCCYSFSTPDNQLVVQFRNPDGSLTAAVMVAGFIQVLDATHTTYTVIDDSGSKTGDVFNVATDSVACDNNRLLFNFSDGSQQTFITGKGLTPIAAGKNAQAGASAKDLLTFAAETTNHTTNGGTIVHAANIRLPGTWDVQNGLVFQVSGGTGGANPLNITFVGGFKGISAGFMYTPAGGGQGVFVVTGQHTWNSGTVSWDVVIGFSQKKFTGKLSGAVVLNDGLTISGDFQVSGASGAHNFQLELKVKKTFNNAGMLLLTADVSSVAGAVSYDIGVQGTFNFNGITLTFDVKVASSGTTSVTVSLASSANTHDLMLQLGLVLKGTGTSPSISFTFTLTMTFQNGHLVKGQPKPLGAGPQAAPLSAGNPN